MEISKGVDVDYKEGNAVLTVKVVDLIQPLLEKFKADVNSGAVDPIKGTDYDKMAILAGIELLETWLKK